MDFSHFFSFFGYDNSSAIGYCIHIRENILVIQIFFASEKKHFSKWKVATREIAMICKTLSPTCLPAVLLAV